MIRLTLGEIAQIVDGVLNEAADPSTVVSGSVEFDSRRVGEDDLFLALPGEKADGHDYVLEAQAQGAVAALVTRDVDVPAIRVADGRAALTALAAEQASRLTSTTTIVLTGSSGKTSAKDLLAQILETAGTTVATLGSFNNELGHPYTVLRANEATQYLVLEAGARGIGHIRELTTVAPPRIGVVLNVGDAHVGEFGSRDITALAKGELVEALPPAQDGGVAVLNADDALVRQMAARTRARVVFFGESATAQVRATQVALDDLGRASFQLNAAGDSAAVQLRLTGEHHVHNALAAAAAALECGLSLQAIAQALSNAEARSKWRMEITERSDGLVVINDAYNANPESMRAALKTLAHIGRARQVRTWAVLGGMAELGEHSRQAHDDLGRLAVRLDISQVLAVGVNAKPIAHGAALEGSWDGESVWVSDQDEALQMIRENIGTNDVVLVKASRSEGLERVALELLDGDQAAARAVGDAPGDLGAGVRQ